MNCSKVIIKLKEIDLHSDQAILHSNWKIKRAADEEKICNLIQNQI